MLREYICQSSSQCDRSVKKSGKQSIGRSRGGLTTKIHLCSSSSKFAFLFHLSAENRNDAPEGRKLIRSMYSQDMHILIADRAYEDKQTRTIMKEQGFIPVIPPKKNRKQRWEYDKELYKRRNEIERYFCRLERFGKVFVRHDRSDIMFISVIRLAMIFDALLM